MGEIKESTHRMSIKGTSVEVIVVLVVFPPPVYMRDRKFYLSPLTVVIEISVGMTGVSQGARSHHSKPFAHSLLTQVEYSRTVAMTGIYILCAH